MRLGFRSPSLQQLNLKMQPIKIFGADKIPWSPIEHIKESATEIVVWAMPVIFLSGLVQIFGNISISKLNFQFV